MPCAPSVRSSHVHSVQSSTQPQTHPPNAKHPAPSTIHMCEHIITLLFGAAPNICIEPQKHPKAGQWNFDLSYFAFEKLAHPEYGVMMVDFRCVYVCVCARARARARVRVCWGHAHIFHGIHIHGCVPDCTGTRQATKALVHKPRGSAGGQEQPAARDKRPHLMTLLGRARQPRLLPHRN